MAKRKLDEGDSVTSETKEPAVKKLKLDSSESARAKVFNNPDLPHVIGSFLGLKDYTKFGSSYKNGHSQLIKSERGAKVKAMYICIKCKSQNNDVPHRLLAEKTGRFKPGRYCHYCFPLKCDGWNCRAVKSRRDMEESAGADGLYCDDCEPPSDKSESGSEEEEDDDDDSTCVVCGVDQGCLPLSMLGRCLECIRTCDDCEPGSDVSESGGDDDGSEEDNECSRCHTTVGADRLTDRWCVDCCNDARRKM